MAAATPREHLEQQRVEASLTGGAASDASTDSCEDQSEEEEVNEQPEVTKDRLYVLDNAKFVLIICVVLTHLLAPLEGSNLTSRLFEGARFAFMMPTFTFISGYCSSTEMNSPRKYDATLKVVSIYILAQAFWLVLARYKWWGFWDMTCFGKIIAGNAWWFVKDLDEDQNQTWRIEDWLRPYFHLWYLFCLIWWRIILPYWWRLKYPLVTAWIVAALFCAYDMYRADPFHTWMVDLSYVVAWFPLFCFGTTAKQANWKMWNNPMSALVGFLAICSIAWIPIVFKPPGVFTNGVIWAYGTSLTNFIGEGFWPNTLMFAIRLAVPLAHGMCIWGFLHIMPRGNLPVITKGGERCLANYILHPLGGCLISLLGVYGPKCDGKNLPAWSELWIIMFSIVSSIFWTSRWVWMVVWPLCDPPVHLLLRSP